MGVDAGMPPGLWERIRSIIREEMAKFARSGFLRNASISEGGTFTIKGGRLRVLYPADQGGGDSVYCGDIYSGGTYVGTGLLVQGPGGKDLVSFRSDVATGSTYVILRDSAENAVLYTSTAGDGLVRPYIGGAFHRQRFADWTVATTAAAFEGLWKGELVKQHGRLSVATQASMDTSGTTGEVRVLVNGQQLGDVKPIGYALTVSLFGPAAVPGANMELLTVEIQGRRTSATGALRVEPLHLLGRG